MVSTWQFHPMSGNGLYGRVWVLRAGRNEPRAPPAPMISSEEWGGGWSSGIATAAEEVAAVLTWTAEGRERERREDWFWWWKRLSLGSGEKPKEALAII